MMLAERCTFPLLLQGWRAGKTNTRISDRRSGDGKDVRVVSILREIEMWWLRSDRELKPHPKLEPLSAAKICDFSGETMHTFRAPIQSQGATFGSS